ncbi:MAG: Hpt domain-containing protein [Rhizobacter sp.]|nr:Hpt domain-containing protein [Rhizobacter sp.]
MSASPTLNEHQNDLSALAWVHEELRRSLDAAHKALRRFVKETEALASSDIDAVDPVVLRTARSQIHQGVGALELVGLPTAATVLRASEMAVQRFVSKPQKLTSAAVDDIERASFALLDYIGRILAGKPVSTLSLFPQYRAVQEIAGADRAHPADLWPIDWQWRDLPTDPNAAPRHPDGVTHVALEAQLLAFLRNAEPTAAAGRMSDICAGLGAGATEPQVATMWKLASGVFEAQARGLLGFDVFSKRVASRLLSQYRILERGDSEVSERLAQDLLFFCAQSASPGDGRQAPRVAAVRQAFGLAHHVPADYASSVLGRFDPSVIAQARKRVAAAKEAWSAVAGGERHRLPGLAEQFALVGESLKKLFPFGESFAVELQQAVVQTQQSGAAPPASLAMEVATSLLYVEAALDDGDFDHPDQATRVRRLAERLGAVSQGQPPEPLEGWMEDLYRRVSDRQTMGSVVQELRASLSEAEKLIDQFFRKPEDRHVLIPVPNQLSAMRGVLSVLGMDHASAALLRMRDEVDGLASTEVDPQRVAQAGVFERLAGNLGALGFLIDMLSVQPQMAKSLFTYDAAAGTLSPVMGRTNASARPGATQGAAPVEQRLIEQAQSLAFASARGDVPTADVSRDLERLSNEAHAADQPALAATVLRAMEGLEQADGPEGVAVVRGALSDALVDFVSTASDPVGLGAERVPEPSAVVSAPISLDFNLDAIVPMAGGTGPGHPDFSQDSEMREIFLEEAREVLVNASSAHADWVRAPSDLGLATTLRRAFHTLKGSSRMVGLKEFGEAAWACEQLYNNHLADQRDAQAPLLDFTAWSLAYLSEWTEDIAAGRPAAHDALTIERAAGAVAEKQAAGAAEEHADLALPFGFPPDLPSAADLDLAARSSDTAASGTEPLLTGGVEVIEPGLPELPELSFELDLADLELPSLPDESELLSEHAELDLSVPALLDPFDVQLTEPLPLAEVIEDQPADLAFDLLDLKLDFGDELSAAPFDQAPIAAPVEMAVEAIAEPGIGPELEPEFGAEAEDTSSSLDDEQVKCIGPLRIGIPLFNIYLNEADELSRRLSTELAEWAMELHRPIGETPIALAHSLAGSSATVGFADLSHLARALEHAQARTLAIGLGTPEEARLFVDAAEEIRRLLHQFAAGFLKEPSPELLARLAEHELSSVRRLQAAAAELETEAEAESAPAALNGPVVEPVVEAAPFHAAAATAFGALETRFEPLGLTELKPFGAMPVEAPRHATGGHDLLDADDVIDAVDAVDDELFPIFEEEAEELLPQLGAGLRDWVRHPTEAGPPAACMRALHTLKGGARLAGAMRLGELAHRLETRIERVLANPPVAAADVETMQSHADGLSQTFEALRRGGETADAPDSAPNQAIAAKPASPEPALADATPAPELPVLLDAAPSVTATTFAALPSDSAGEADAAAEGVAPATPGTGAEPEPLTTLAEVDWSRFAPAGIAAAVRKAPERQQGAQSAVRVRAPLLDRLVNQAGEVSIARSRIESGVGQIKGSLGDLTENLERLRAQLRDIEFHGEMQMSSRLEAAKAASLAFDPLEFDRFTRFQELTRMMAESVNDVATVQRSLQRSLETTEDELVAQARMTRELQEDLLRTRMVEFEGLSDRLYRVVRQAAKETGKSVRLDIVGGAIEVDRGVLDRMTASFEHIVRNCVTHGIEAPDARATTGKDATGTIVVALSQEGNEVGIEFRDDGAGLDLGRIRAKGLALGLLDVNQPASDADLANLIFTPGFSTAEVVTELSGRGVGMDVVRSEVNSMGGRIETATASGQGTSFRLILPLTTAVTQVVMLRCGDIHVSVPSTLVEVVRRVTVTEIDEAYASGTFAVGDRALQFFWLGALLQSSPLPERGASRGRTVVVIRSAQQRIALHVDEVVGNQEVVVKNLGPQLSRLPGLAGTTLLASGAVALIYNPVALATLYGESARAATQAAMRTPGRSSGAPLAHAPAASAAPLVMVVDDSLTVRRVTQRLLLREGYRVVLAKDGLDALERLAEAVPAIVLSDIEMPRMDGFDLVRNMRADARLRDLPVIMITSRIAQKHREYAAELGVDHYLGKPYSEEDLLALVARYTRSGVSA